MDSLLPFLQGFCLPCNMAVYPGAQRVVAYSDPRKEIVGSELPVTDSPGIA